MVKVEAAQVLVGIGTVYQGVASPKLTTTDWPQVAHSLSCPGASRQWVGQDSTVPGERAKIRGSGVGVCSWGIGRGYAITPPLAVLVGTPALLVVLLTLIELL